MLICQGIAQASEKDRLRRKNKIPSVEHLLCAGAVPSTWDIPVSIMSNLQSSRGDRRLERWKSAEVSNRW